MMQSYKSTVIERIKSRLKNLYGGRAELLTQRAAMMIGRYGLNGSGTAHSKNWNQSTAILITYGDMVSAENKRPLVSLSSFLDGYCAGIFTHVHILPFFPYSSDDGFSVIHYRTVHPDIGRWPDITAISKRFQLVFDLVLNHISSESGWFKDYQTGVAPGCQYFIEGDPDANLSSVTRPRTSPLLTPAMTPAGRRYVWTTFSADQVDLNFSNPDVLFEMLDILLFYVYMGARIIRLDAIAYLWKKTGTTCVNLPETHEIVKLFRDILELADPGVILLTETNLPHAENVSYFGSGDEAQLIYQFSLPPLILHAITFGTAQYLNEWAENIEPPPPGCTFLNFTASHDGIGVRPLESIVPAEDVRKLADHTIRRGGRVSSRKQQDGSETPYELNITWFDAVSGEPGESEEANLRRFACSQAIMLAVRGIPAVYFNNLLAAGNDYELEKQTGRARSLNRGKWKLDQIESAVKDPNSIPGAAMQFFAGLLNARSSSPAFHPEASQKLIRVNEKVFAVKRVAQDKSSAVLTLHNLSGEKTSIPLSRLPDVIPGSTSDLITGKPPLLNNSSIELEGFGFAWLTCNP